MSIIIKSPLTLILSPQGEGMGDWIYHIFIGEKGETDG